MKIGIFGGGQLAMMLAEAANKLNISITVFDADSNCPAKKYCDNFVMNRGQKEDYINFLNGVDVAVFENEFVDCNFLASLKNHISAKFVPNLDSIALLQDKLEQKKILTKLGIPVAPYETFIDGSLESWIEKVLKQWESGVVFKWSRFGYDGKGVFVTSSKNDQKEKIKNFCQSAIQKGVSVYAEKRIPFVRELAMVSVRATSSFQFYPLVITQQQNGICDIVFGPATSRGVSKKNQEKASAWMEQLSVDLNYFGAFAFEFFETDGGDLFVNEIAPRVHNSGHYTQLAAKVSQFENHLRAALGMTLGSTETSDAFLMVNFIGPENIIVKNSKAILPGPLPSKSALCWYEKSEIRPGRKVGHINVSADSQTELETIYNDLLRMRANWIERLSNGKEENT